MSLKPTDRPVPPLAPAPWPVRLLRLGRLALHLVRGLWLVGTRYHRLSLAGRAVITQRWSCHLMKILGMEVRIVGTPPSDVFPPNTLLVANHVSWLDIFALNSVTVSRFVAKKEIRDWPVVGWLAKNAGTIFIDRSNRRDASRVNTQLARALESGGCMAVFPEGTTSDGSGLLPFKASLFESVRLSRGMVQPVAIRYFDAAERFTTAAAYAGDLKLIASLGNVLRMRHMTVELAFGQPLQAGSSRYDSRFALSEAARGEVARRLMLLPAPPDMAETLPPCPPV